MTGFLYGGDPGELDLINCPQDHYNPLTRERWKTATKPICNTRCG